MSKKLRIIYEKLCMAIKSKKFITFPSWRLALHRRRRVNLFVLKALWHIDFLLSRKSAIMKNHQRCRSNSNHPLGWTRRSISLSNKIIIIISLAQRRYGRDAMITVQIKSSAMLFIFASDEPTALLAKVRCGDDTRANRTHTCKSWLILYQVAPQAPPDVGAQTQIK